MQLKYVLESSMDSNKWGVMCMKQCCWNIVQKKCNFWSNHSISTDNQQKCRYTWLNFNIHVEAKVSCVSSAGRTFDIYAEAKRMTGFLCFQCWENFWHLCRSKAYDMCLVFSVLGKLHGWEHLSPCHCGLCFHSCHHLSLRICEKVSNLNHCVLLFRWIDFR